jgi:hypothetical protein
MILLATLVIFRKSKRAQGVRQHLLFELLGWLIVLICFFIIPSLLDNEIVFKYTQIWGMMIPCLTGQGVLIIRSFMYQASNETSSACSIEEIVDSPSLKDDEIAGSPTPTPKITLKNVVVFGLENANILTLGVIRGAKGFSQLNNFIVEKWPLSNPETRAIANDFCTKIQFLQDLQLLIREIQVKYDNPEVEMTKKCHLEMLFYFRIWYLNYLIFLLTIRMGYLRTHNDDYVMPGFESHSTTYPLANRPLEIDDELFKDVEDCLTLWMKEIGTVDHKFEIVYKLRNWVLVELKPLHREFFGSKKGQDLLKELAISTVGKRKKNNEEQKQSN